MANHCGLVLTRAKLGNIADLRNYFAVKIKPLPLSLMLVYVAAVAYLCDIMMKRLPILIVAAALALSLRATDYKSLSVKADRFFAQREWASASAMFELMLDSRPGTPRVYGRAIVAAAMAGDTVAEMELVNRSIINYVPFDSTFAAVRSASFELGRTNLYEDFLLRVRESEPWLSRTVDAYLMRYYAFRRNPAMMVAYSEEMLRGMPDDLGFMSTLAQGLMLEGRPGEAMEVYDRMLAANPADYDALLEIGNYNYMLWAADRSNTAARQKAVETLTKALSLRATPYVVSMLSRLKAGA